LNFIYKYYSRYDEFRSIVVDRTYVSMPDSNTSDAVYFQMAINACKQLRVYWLSRYVASLPTNMSSYPMNNAPIHSNNYRSVTSTMNTTSQCRDHCRTNDDDSFKHRLVSMPCRLDTMSYIDHPPAYYIRCRSSMMSHDYHKYADESSSTDVHVEHQVTSTNIEMMCHRSIHDYANNDNIELFYRILASDCLAGSPFCQHIHLIVKSTDEIRTIENYIRFIGDAEILLSMVSNKFKDRLVRQFISR
jgi:hypothetical protein